MTGRKPGLLFEPSFKVFLFVEIGIRSQAPASLLPPGYFIYYLFIWTYKRLLEIINHPGAIFVSQLILAPGGI